MKALANIVIGVYALFMLVITLASTIKIYSEGNNYGATGAFLSVILAALVLLAAAKGAY